MTSYIQKTLTGAALVADMTLGGLTSAYAQFQQPYDEPYQEEEPVVIMDEDEGLDGLLPGLWIYDGDEMSVGHEWVGLAGGKLKISGFYHNFEDIYHKAGWGFSAKIDQFWVTLDSLNAGRYLPNTKNNKFILDISEGTVYGEPFGVKTADKKIIIHDGNAPAISYGGKMFNGSGVGKDTNIQVSNTGTIHDIEIYAGTLNNWSKGTVNNVLQHNGNCRNEGNIDTYTMYGGYLDNSKGRIETLYWGGGTIDRKGIMRIGQIIEIDAATAGADAGYVDEGYVDEGYVADPIIVLDNAAVDNGDWDAGDWQDAAPLGEEAMLW